MTLISTIDNEILRVQNGSKLYGLDHPGSDDDFVSVFVEDSGYVFSFNTQKSINLSASGPNERTVAGESDGTAYSVRHFFNLLLKGNPSLLILLYANNDNMLVSTPQSDLIRGNRDLFVSRNAGNKFFGYMRNQMERLTGVRSGHKPARPEIVAQYGYDTKYAAQIARLAFQGIEYMKTGHVTLPMPDRERALCRDMRHGGLTYEHTISTLNLLQGDLDDAVDRSTLPEKPNHEGVHKLSRRIHEEVWET